MGFILQMQGEFTIEDSIVLIQHIKGHKKNSLSVVSAKKPFVYILPVSHQKINSGGEGGREGGRTSGRTHHQSNEDCGSHTISYHLLTKSQENSDDNVRYHGNYLTLRCKFKLINKIQNKKYDKIFCITQYITCYRLFYMIYKCIIIYKHIYII